MPSTTLKCTETNRNTKQEMYPKEASTTLKYMYFR